MRNEKRAAFENHPFAFHNETPQEIVPVKVAGLLARIEARKEQTQPLLVQTVGKVLGSPEIDNRRGPLSAKAKRRLNTAQKLAEIYR